MARLPLLSPSECQGETDAAQQHPSLSAERRQRWLQTLLALQSVLILGLLSALFIGPHLRQGLLHTHHHFGFDSPIYMSECMHPLGGGQVQWGGGFRPLNDTVVSDECAAELYEYFSKEEGQYWVDVARVAEAAREYFDALSLIEPPTTKKLIVFDIDETSLSNAEEWQAALARRLQRQGRESQGQQGRRGPHWQQHWWSQQDGQRAGTPPSLIAGAGQASGRESLRLQKVQDGASDRPPLAPMLALYQYLFASGYSVAFITGRNETQRNSTTTNLLGAGYGRMCHKGELDELDQQHRVHKAMGEGRRQRRPTAACYAALHLRDNDDDRFASVYKPSRRQLLINEGYTIYGNFGDQFSDLDGDYGAPHSFKLPNPAYYIL